MTTSRPKLTSEQALVLGILTSKARGKEHYAKAASRLTELQARVAVGSPVELPDGRKFAVVDTFENEKQAKKFVLIDRYEVRELK